MYFVQSKHSKIQFNLKSWQVTESGNWLLVFIRLPQSETVLCSVIINLKGMTHHRIRKTIVSETRFIVRFMSFFEYEVFIKIYRE